MRRSILLVLLKVSVETSLSLRLLILINGRRWSVLRLGLEFIHAVLAYLWRLLIYIGSTCALAQVRVLVVARLVAYRWATRPECPGVWVVGVVVASSAHHADVVRIHRRHLSMLLRSSIWTLSVYKIVSSVLECSTATSTLSLFTQKPSSFHLVFSLLGPVSCAHTVTLTDTACGIHRHY